MPENRFTPCVILPGIGQSKVELVDNKGKKVKMAWPPEFDSQKLLDKLKAPLMKMMLFRKDGGFSDKVAALVKETIEPLTMNSDGTFKNSLKTVCYPYSIKECTPDEKRFIYKMVPLQGLADKIGEENLYYFAYNSFADPYETADMLDAFIEKIKVQTDSEKVNLVPVSLGGSLSIAYFDRYAYKNSVKRVMYFVAALGGTHLAADICAKKFTDKSPVELIKALLPANKADELSGMVSMLPSDVPMNILDKVITAVLDTFLLNSASMWGTIPPERYEELSAMYLSDKNRQSLKEKTDAFYKVRKDFPDLVREMEKQGVEFFSVCGYGKNLFPLVASSYMSSDGIVNVASPSLGARSAPVGEKLEPYDGIDRICRDKTHNHISPDGSIDASCGLWPERTWYFSSQGHDAIAYNDKALKIAELVLSDDEFKDIYSDPALPQFCQAEDNRK